MDFKRGFSRKAQGWETWAVVLGAIVLGTLFLWALYNFFRGMK